MWNIYIYDNKFLFIGFFLCGKCVYYKLLCISRYFRINKNVLYLAPKLSLTKCAIYSMKAGVPGRQDRMLIRPLQILIGTLTVWVCLLDYCIDKSSAGMCSEDIRCRMGMGKKIVLDLVLLRRGKERTENETSALVGVDSSHIWRRRLNPSSYCSILCLTNIIER